MDNFPEETQAPQEQNSQDLSSQESSLQTQLPEDSSGQQSPPQTLNPWFSMWTKPRATIQQIVDTDSERMVLVITAIFGVTYSLNRAMLKGFGDKYEWAWIVLFSIILGPIGAIFKLYLMGFLISWTGRWIGGKATAKTIRIATAWSCVPVIWSLLNWVIGLMLFRQELFTTETPGADAYLFLWFAYLAFCLTEVIIATWTVVIYFKSLGQVQGFSAWKAVLNFMLAGMIILVPIMILAVGVFAILVFVSGLSDF